MESLMSKLGSDLKLNIQESLDREDLLNETTWGAEWSKAVHQRAIAERPHQPNQRQ
jgi:hypothetical protein